MTTGAHVRPDPPEALPREVQHRRVGDLAGDRIRLQAIAAVYDVTVDHDMRDDGKRLTLVQVDRICREYEARVRALGGGW